MKIKYNKVSLFIMRTLVISAGVVLFSDSLKAIEPISDVISPVFMSKYPGHLPDEDKDGDGFTYREEYYYGGDPDVADLQNRMTMELGVGGNVILHGNAPKALGFMAETSVDLSHWYRHPELHRGKDDVKIVELDSGGQDHLFVKWVAVGVMDSLDGDDLNNREEFLLGTDPLLADTDGDLISDSEEFLNGTDPLVADVVSSGLIITPLNGAVLSPGDLEVVVNAPTGTDTIQFFINDYNVSSDVTYDNDDTDESFVFRNLQGGSYKLSVVVTSGNGVESIDAVNVSVTPAEISGQYNLRRLNGNKPIVTQKMFEDLGATHRTDSNDYEHENMNGPNVIRIPDFIERSDRPAQWANYYLYFAHHRGRYIRLAYSENIEGPYFLYNCGADVDVQDAGVLSLDHTDAGNALEWSLDIGDDSRGRNLTLFREVASPDVHIDHENERIIMYFHAPVKIDGSGTEQRTFVAFSDDGLNFNDGVVPQIIHKYYAAPFVFEDYLYTYENSGKLSRSHRSVSQWDPWVPVPGENNNNETILDRNGPRPLNVFDGGQVRHIKPWVDANDIQYLFHSTMADTPEQLYYAEIDMQADDWTNWEVMDSTENGRKKLATPEAGWEGGHLPLIASAPSAVKERVNQLRDPEIFEDDDGKLYVFYVGGGEKELGVSEIIFVD